MNNRSQPITFYFDSIDLSETMDEETTDIDDQSPIHPAEPTNTEDRQFVEFFKNEWIITLDTSILTYLATDPDQGLLNLVNEKIASGEFTLLLSEIIRDEWVHRSGKIVDKSLKHLRKLFSKDQLENDMKEVHEAAKEQATARVELINQLVSNARIATNKDTHFKKACKWGLQNLAPYSTTKNGTANALSFLAIAGYINDLCNGVGHTPVAIFVSNDVTAYSANKKDELLPHLHHVCASLHYCKSLCEVLNVKDPEMKASYDAYFQAKV